MEGLIVWLILREINWQDFRAVSRVYLIALVSSFRSGDLLVLDFFSDSKVLCTIFLILFHSVVCQEFAQSCDREGQRVAATLENRHAERHSARPLAPRHRGQCDEKQAPGHGGSSRHHSRFARGRGREGKHQKTADAINGTFDWLIDWLALKHSIGRLIDWLTGGRAFYELIDWLIHRLIDWRTKNWLIDLLIDWLIFRFIRLRCTPSTMKSFLNVFLLQNFYLIQKTNQWMTIWKTKRRRKEKRLFLKEKIEIQSNASPFLLHGNVYNLECPFFVCLFFLSEIIALEIHARVTGAGWAGAGWTGAGWTGGVGNVVESCWAGWMPRAVVVFDQCLASSAGYKRVCLSSLKRLHLQGIKSPVSFYAVYDGHAGPIAATYAAAHLHRRLCASKSYPDSMVDALRDAFLSTDELYTIKGTRDVSFGQKRQLPVRRGRLYRGKTSCSCHWTGGICLFFLPHREITVALRRWWRSFSRRNFTLREWGWLFCFFTSQLISKTTIIWVENRFLKGSKF